MEQFKIEGADGGIEVDRMRKRGETLLYVAKNERLIGLIGMMDQLKPEAKKAVSRLREQGVELVLLTGDHRLTAQCIAHALHIDHFHHGLLPEDKAAHVEKMKAGGKIVGMVGDGINDAVALACSDLGIAIGAGGSDVAVEAADVALAGNDLNKIPELTLLGRKTLRIIKQNYAYSMGLNALGIILGALGKISPFTGGCCMWPTA